MNPLRIALAAALALAVHAEDVESPGKVALNAMKKYDTNGDGAISKSEAPNGEFMKTYDGDQDGRVTGTEIRQVEEAARDKSRMEMPKRKPTFRGLDDFGDHDLDADGRLSKKELESYVHDGADNNRDGFLSEEEFRYVDRSPRADTAVDLDSFDKLDADRNRLLSVAELALPRAYLDSLDRNGDRGVSKEELIETQVERWGGVPGPNAEVVLRRMDADGDGELSRKEFDGRDRLWNEINGYRPEKEDAALSKEELEAYFRRVRDLRLKANGFLTRYDMNGDGKVTRDEFDGPDAAWDRCDTNGDGLITRADGPE